MGGTAKAGVEASKAEVEVNNFVFSKLRNSDVIESMGMLPNLIGRWFEAGFTALTPTTQRAAS